MWIVWILKSLCILNLFGVFYKLYLLFDTILYIQTYISRNAVDIFLLFSISFIIYSIYVLMSRMIDLEVQLLKKLEETNQMVKEMYDLCQIK